MNTKDIVIVGLVAILLAKDCKLKAKDEQLNSCKQKLKSNCCVYKRYRDCSKHC